jgi:hypothetical protein
MQHSSTPTALGIQSEKGKKPPYATNWEPLSCVQIVNRLRELSVMLATEAEKLEKQLDANNVAGALETIKVINGINREINEGVAEYEKDGCGGGGL